MRISDWSSDVCSSDLDLVVDLQRRNARPRVLFPIFFRKLDVFGQVDQFGLIWESRFFERRMGCKGTGSRIEVQFQHYSFLLQPIPVRACARVAAQGANPDIHNPDRDLPGKQPGKRGPVRRNPGAGWSENPRPSAKPAKISMRSEEHTAEL